LALVTLMFFLFLTPCLFLLLYVLFPNHLLLDNCPRFSLIHNIASDGQHSVMDISSALTLPSPLFSFIDPSPSPSHSLIHVPGIPDPRGRFFRDIAISLLSSTLLFDRKPVHLLATRPTYSINDPIPCELTVIGENSSLPTNN